MGYVLGVGGQSVTKHADAVSPPVSANTAQQEQNHGLPSQIHATDSGSAERGQALFAMKCSFCHGATARGGETGPDLIRSVIVLDDEKGEKIGAVVLTGRPERGMPKFELSADQISDLVTFLHREVKAATAFQSYKVLNIVTGDAGAGKTYFYGAGQCSRCHSITGDLAHIGSKYSPEDLQQKFIMPRDELSSGNHPQDPRSAIRAKVSLPSGEMVTGQLAAIDDFRIVLMDEKGERRSFVRNGDAPPIELRDPLQQHVKLLKQYTDSDIHNLTAWLVTLK